MSLPKPGPVALAAVVAATRKETLSVREVGGNNKGKWIMVYLSFVGLFEPAAWCCAFVVTQIVKASIVQGVKLPKWFKKTGLCQALVNAAKAQGLWIDIADAKSGAVTVYRGDLACFWFTKYQRIAHIGHVTAVHSWGVETVEGNTGSDGKNGVERDGDGVYEKDRDWSELGVNGGFIRLPF